MPTNAKVGPKDFFLWAGAMVALYAGVVSFIALLFNYIEYAFPNALAYGSPYSRGISYQMASLIVLTPVLLVLMRMIRGTIAKDPSRQDIWVRRWALYLTVFIAGATVVGDLIILLTTFLQGHELTAGFLLKTLVVLLVAGAAFLHFLADLRGYYGAHPGRASMIMWSVGVCVVIAIVSGFLIVGTPYQARMYLQDQQKISDLQGIQSQIVLFYQQKEELPETLLELEDPLSGYAVPTDAQTGEPYRYEKTGNLSFSICAAFNKESRGDIETRPVYGFEQENWQHPAGEHCFDRTIDPERYRPFGKPVL